MKNLISISKPFIDKSEITSVVKVLKSGHIVEGDQVKQLEETFSRIYGVKHAIAVNNGTSALHCALFALGIGPGDEVITTPFTFISTANAILMVGATPVFADIKKDTFTIDPVEIVKKCSKKTKAIIAVDLYGQPADYEEIANIAKKYNIAIIDDAAQAIGARYKSKFIGTVADITCFSFYATKNIMCGEGGMVTTNNKTYAEIIKKFKNHGQRPGVRYSYEGFGMNYRMTDIAGAIVLDQLRREPLITKIRQRNAMEYTNHFSNINGITVPIIDTKRTHVFHQYTLRITDQFPYTRDELRDYLRLKNIQSEVYYPTPLFFYSHLINKRINQKYFKETILASKQVLSIPVHPRLAKAEIDYIIHTIKSI